MTLWQALKVLPFTLFSLATTGICGFFSGLILGNPFLSPLGGAIVGMTVGLVFVGNLQKDGLFAEVPELPEPIVAASIVTLDDYGNTVCDGKRVLPVFLYSVPDEDLPEMVGLGFNTLFAFGNRATELGAYSINTGHWEYGAEPNYLGGILPDEADLNWNGVDEDSLYSPASIARRCADMEAHDPGHLKILVLNGGAGYQWWEQYVAAGPDVFMLDPYPVISGRPLVDLAQAMQAMRFLTDKPIWVIHQAWCSDPDGKEMPTPAENRASVYLSIVQGAKGIAWYAYRFQDRHVGEYELVRENFPDLWTSIVQVARELAQMHEALVEPRAVETRFVNKRLRFLERSDGENLWVISINPSERDLGSQTLALQRWLRQPGVAEVLGENRQVIVKRTGALKDTFGPLAVHIYWIPLPSD